MGGGGFTGCKHIPLAYRNIILYTMHIQLIHLENDLHPEAPAVHF